MATLLLLVGNAGGMTSETLTNSALALARLQTGEGGALKLDFDGSVNLPETLRITTNTTVDASGHELILDGENRVRHFTVTNGASLRLINLQLINGRAATAGVQTNQLGANAYGGSIFLTGGTVELIGCAFVNNQATGTDGGPADSSIPAGLQAGMTGGAAYGGAIYSMDGQLVITNCLFADNTAAGGLGAISGSGYTGGGGDCFGGAIYSTNSRSILVGVTFTNNLAKAGEMSGGRPLAGGGSANGGALAGEVELLTMIDCIFSGNRAAAGTKVGSDTSRETGLARGGALSHGSGTLSINNTLFEKNSSHGGLGNERGGAQIVFGDGQGGAVYTGGDLDIRNSSLVLNTVSGGDVPPDCCSPFIGQAGAARGGGIANAGRLTIVNCTFAQNSATAGKAVSVGVFAGPAYGGGLAVSTGSVSLVNVTLDANRAESSSVRKAFGSSVSVLAGTAFCTNTILFSLPGQTNVFGTLMDGGHNICSDASAAFTAASSRQNLDPLLAALSNNDGPTPTSPLRPDSPAIDAGDDSACPPTDQRGVARPMGLTCDIGAFELVPKLTISRSVAGRVNLNYAFRAAQPSRISASTNLVNWIPLGQVTSDKDGQIQFEDNTSAGPFARFYQVQSSPSGN